jgi:hypothetical protein
MCVRERWVQFQRLSGCADRFWQHFTRRSHADPRSTERTISGGQSNVSRMTISMLSKRQTRIRYELL